MTRSTICDPCQPTFESPVASLRSWHAVGTFQPRHLRLQGGLADNSMVNGSAIGTQASVRIAKLGMISPQVEGNTGASVKNDQALHFGLGEHSKPIDLEILWPGGSVQTVSQLPVEQLHTIRASTSKAAN